MVFRRLALFAAIFLGLLLGFGCSGKSTSPVEPVTSTPQSSQMIDIAQSHTQLWGLYEISIDIANKTADAALLRTAMFTANVVKFINQKPTNLKFKINDTPMGTDYIDVDIDVTISHPFPGFHQYDGYDVRGVFMGDGSASLAYNSDLEYPVNGTDQFMLPDPDDGLGGVGRPDGYTRWYNLTEFSTGTMPLFSYTPGTFASKGFSGNATLCPYKYFADGLSTDEPLAPWLENNIDNHGIFSAGSSNTRNYYLRFPNSTGVKYGYAIIASWGGVDPEFHPWNAPEAVACETNYTGNVFYIDPDTNGGQLAMDIDLYNWHGQPSSIFIESTVLSALYEFTPSDLTPIGGNEIYSTYQIEIPADNVTGVDGNEYWIIAEYGDYDYSNPYGIPNDAENDTLAGFFRFDLEVSANPTNQNPVCDLTIDPSTPVPATDLSPVAITFDATGSFDPDNDPMTYEWDFNGDGTFDGADDSYKGSPEKPTHGYLEDYVGKAYVKVSDGMGGESICDIDVDVTAYPSKNLPLRPGVTAYDLAFESGDGDLTILYSDEYVYKYLPSEYYQTGNSFYQKLYNTWPAPQFHESTPVGYTGNGGYVTVGTPPWTAPQIFIYKPNAAGPFDFEHIWSLQYTEPMPVNKYFDIFAFGTQGSFANDLGLVYGYDVSGAHWIRACRLYDTHFDIGGWYTCSFSGSVFTGYDKLYWEYVVAVETDKISDCLWFLENTDFYASRWVLSGGSLIYDNAYLGTGSQTDNDNGWNDAQDITRDNQNRMFVLDKLSSGIARIKMWTVSGSTTESKGGFGDSTSISGTPLRIEGGDFSGRIFVLHGDTTNGFELSIFSPIEMPD